MRLKQITITALLMFHLFGSCLNTACAAPEPQSPETGDPKVHTNSEKEWHNSAEYSEYIWKRPQEGYSGTGTITLKCLLPEKNWSLRIALDKAWLKDGIYARPEDEGAHEMGSLPAGYIAGGATKNFEVSAGKHHLCVGDDLYASDTLNVVVNTNQTVNIECGKRYHGLKKTWYGIYYLFHKQIPGKQFYFMRIKESG